MAKRASFANSAHRGTAMMMNIVQVMKIEVKQLFLTVELRGQNPSENALKIDNKRISTKYTRSMNINEWNNSTGNITWNGQNGNLVI
jgi:hypothetical protein